MAKKKNDVELDAQGNEIVENSSVSDKLGKAITKEYGENIIRMAGDVFDKPKMVIPVSPAIDIALNGGLQEGTFNTFTGVAKSGKSSLSLWIASKAQQERYGGRTVYYSNAEGRLKERDLKGIPGLDMSRFHVIGSTKKVRLTAEKHLSIAERVLIDDPGCMWICDSFSALATEKELTSGMDEMQRADGAKLLAKFCRRIGEIVSLNDCIVIGMTHLSANVSGYGAAYTEGGGMKIAYQADNKLRIKKFEPWRLNEDGKQIGQIVTWQCICSALGPPGMEVQSYLRYGHGIDEVYEVASFGIDLGLVDKAGSWLTYKDTKVQGKEKLVAHLQENPELISVLRNEVMELFGVQAAVA